MEEYFSRAVSDLDGLRKFTKEDRQALELADRVADELAVSEFEHYMAHEVNMDAIKVARKHGLFKIPIQKEFGGLDRGMLVTALVEQRLGQIGLGVATLFDVQIFLGALGIQDWGSKAQKDRYLRPAAAGDKIMAFGLTEPDSGSEPTAMKTTYRKKGSGFVIDGTKYLISNGGIADAVIVFAKSAESDGKITAFIIDKGTPGFSVAMHLKDKIGLFTSDTAMLEFKGVEVPAESVLGEVGKGMHIAYSALLNGRIGIASACVGLVEGCLKASVDRARTRVQHGKLIGKHQLVQEHIAEIRQNLEMARWPTYIAAIKKDAYDANRASKALLADADLHSSLAKKVASRAAFNSADRAVQVFGGFGYSLLSPVGQLFCDSRVARIYEGTDEIQELKIAAAVLGDDFKAFS